MAWCWLRLLIDLGRLARNSGEEAEEEKEETEDEQPVSGTEGIKADMISRLGGLSTSSSSLGRLEWAVRCVEG